MDVLAPPSDMNPSGPGWAGLGSAWSVVIGRVEEARKRAGLDRLPSFIPAY